MVSSLPKLQRQLPPKIISDPVATDAFADVRNGIIDTFNDTSQKYKGEFLMPLYVQKTEGYTILDTVLDDDDEPIKAAVRGAALWKNNDQSASNRFHFLFAIKNKIYLKGSSGVSEIYNVEDDGFEITLLMGAQSKNNLYLCIGDKKMDSALYKYIGYLSKKGQTSDGGSGKTKITTTPHSLVDGMTIKWGDTDYVITRVDENEFTVEKAFTGAEEIVWTAEKQFAKQTMTALYAVARISTWESKLTVTGCGADNSIPRFSKTNVFGDFDDFTIGLETIDGGDFYGELEGINCMVRHDGYQVLLASNQITFHKSGQPIISGEAYIRNPNTLQDSLTITGSGTTSPYGAISARGKFFYVDPSSGIMSINVKRAIGGFNNSTENLAAAWQKEFLKYDTTASYIVYDKKRDILLVGAASVKGGILDKILIYSFRTKRWSVDDGKRANQIIPVPEKQELYGFGAITPEVHLIFDGSHNDDNHSKKTIAWTRFYDGGRRAIYKEYENFTQIVGISRGMEDVKFELVDDRGNVLSSTVVDVTEEFGNSLKSLGGKWGEYVVGSGSHIDVTDMIFKQYYNDDPIDDFSRISLRTTEDSKFPFLVFAPEILATTTTDFVEDF